MHLHSWQQRWFELKADKLRYSETQVRLPRPTSTVRPQLWLDQAWLFQLMSHRFLPWPMPLTSRLVGREGSGSGRFP